MNHSTLLGELQIEFCFWDNQDQLLVMKKQPLGSVGNCNTVHLGRTKARQELYVRPRVLFQTSQRAESISCEGLVLGQY